MSDELQITRLLASEHRHIVHQKTAEADRAQLEAEIASLRMQVAKFSGTSRPGM